MDSTRVPIGTYHGFLAVAGAALQMVAGFYVIVWSQLVAPAWGSLVLVAFWLAATVWAIRNWRRHRFITLLAFGSVAVFWVAFLLMGQVLFDWSA